MTDPTPTERDQARAFLRGRASLTLDDLKTAITSVYGDGWQTGALIAVQQTGASVAAGITGVAVPQTPAAWSTFWDKWTPGNTAAADKLSNGGLGLLLEQSDATIQGIADSTLDRLGSLLAEGAANGDSIDTIADSLADLIADPDRAYTIADTEVARAVQAASLDQYSSQDVAEVDWLDSPDACDDCVDNAAGSPYSLDDFPDLPAHPRCRCSSAPHSD